MERIKKLNGYQNGLLIFLAVSLVVFAFIYPRVTSMEGYPYYGKLFLPEHNGGVTTYSAVLEGRRSTFTVDGSEVTFAWGEQVFGPYTVTETPSTVPEDHSFTRGFTVIQGDTMIFQGGAYFGEDWTMLYNQDGSLHGFDDVIIYSDSETDMTPSTFALIQLVTGPTLIRRGTWVGFLLGIFSSTLAVVEILFADELFRFKVAFKVADPDQVDPSDWEIAGRYISWTSLALLAIVSYIVGLFSI